MASLVNINIKFHTYDEDLNDSTNLHVFIKNRRVAKPRGDAASTSLGPTSFIQNQLDFAEAIEDGTSEFNPFLGRLLNVTNGYGFGKNSDHSFDFRPLDMILLEDVELPVVNIHILPDGSDTWIFDYTLTLTFDNGESFPCTSNVNGVSGIILDEKNRDYAGMGIENPFLALPAAPQPETNAVLDRVFLEIYTHDHDKHDDTVVNVHIVNRLSAAGSTDISVALNILPGQGFHKGSKHSLELPLASNHILLADIVLPVVNINIAPNGSDRWNFDYRISYFFKDQAPEVAGVFRPPFSSTTAGVILDQNHHKHTGEYSGRAFPTLNVPPAPLQPFAIDHVFNPKAISLSFIQSKLNDFINNREADPLKIIRFDNSGGFGSAMPASYADIKSIDANPPPPRTVEPLDFDMGVTYNSSPMDLGQIRAAHGIGDLYLQDLNSDSITVTVRPDLATPFEVIVTFETNGPEETVGGNKISFSGMKFTSFFVRILLTLRFNEDKGYVDLMAWVDDYNGLTYIPLPDGYTWVRGSFLGQPIDETVPNVSTFQDDLIGSVLHVGLTADAVAAGSLQKSIRGLLYGKLTTPDPITLASPRDTLNAMINSWFMGGVVEIGHTAPVEYPNPNRLIAAEVTGGNLVLNYIGPPFSFVYDQPWNWPKGVDFAPGTLSNIDHIVVLTMENRSFDHMLGYLSLPEVMGGLNRQDVDGLKGSEFNLVNGVPARIYRFQPGETIFTPDPPHDTEPAIQAINGGLMDGFAQNYADLRGREMGPNIMGYQTADTVPVYDSLARDFAIGHRWFSPHPGPTFCNRFYETTGRLNIDPWGYWEYSNSSPLLPVFTDTIFDHLTEQKVSWTYFEHFYCFLRFFERHTYDTQNIVSFLDPEFGFVNMAKTGNLPSVSFIDPHFVELPPDGNCDGPPADVKNGQALVETVVNAVVSGPKWAKTLLIVTYDEHGGFYDHVPPSPAAKVSPELFGFTGVRVPVFVITPWVKNGSVFGHDGLIQTGGGAGTGTVGNGGGSVSSHPQGAALDAAGAPRSSVGGSAAAGAASGVTSAQTAQATATATSVSQEGRAGSATAGSAEPTSVISQFHNLHFDHTSILKTIARRFMSTNPPYMGARYAAAHDLSEVLTSTAQNSQFLPFIPYTMVYQGLNLTLDVASLIVDPANPAPEQDFRLEDAGGGFFYIRTLGNLYLTVEVPTGASTGPGTSLTVAPAAKLSPASDLQRWKMSSNSVVVESTDFTVSPAAFPDKALQPVGDSSVAGTAIAVADRAPPPPLQTPNPWSITSPLLPTGGLLNHP